MELVKGDGLSHAPYATPDILPYPMRLTTPLPYVGPSLASSPALPIHSSTVDGTRRPSYVKFIVFGIAFPTPSMDYMFHLKFHSLHY